jgi:hypothetical protein
VCGSGWDLKSQDGPYNLRMTVYFLRLPPFPWLRLGENQPRLTYCCVYYYRQRNLKLEGLEVVLFGRSRLEDGMPAIHYLFQCPLNILLNKKVFSC